MWNTMDAWILQNETLIFTVCEILKRNRILALFQLISFIPRENIITTFLFILVFISSIYFII